MAGPNIIVSGAIFNEGLVSQTLTDYISFIPRINKNNRSPLDDAAYRVARLCYALRMGVGALDHYYSLLVKRLTPRRSQPDTAIPGTSMSAAENIYHSPSHVQSVFIGPHLHTFSDPVHGEVHLAYHVRRCEPFQRTVFVAEASNHAFPVTKVIVKFAYRYNKNAHELLAAANYAPKLFYCERRDDFGGLWVVVMAHSTGHHPNSISGPLVKQLRECLQILHRDDLVFGDLRWPNILVESEDDSPRLMLIDFDWCGEKDKARYPSDILLEEGKFHPGVEKGGRLMIEHDEYLFHRLTRKAL
jgi:hypothetical protein